MLAVGLGHYRNAALYNREFYSSDMEIYPFGQWPKVTLAFSGHQGCPCPSPSQYVTWLHSSAAGFRVPPKPSPAMPALAIGDDTLALTAPREFTRSMETQRDFAQGGGKRHCPASPISGSYLCISFYADSLPHTFVSSSGPWHLHVANLARPTTEN